MPPCCFTQDRDLFFQNMQFVRTVALACAQFCPQAIIAIQTPPVDCNFTLIKHVSFLALLAFLVSKVATFNAKNDS